VALGPGSAVGDQNRNGAINPLGVQGCGEAGVAGAFPLDHQRHPGRADTIWDQRSSRPGDTGTDLAGDQGPGMLRQGCRR